MTALPPQYALKEPIFFGEEDGEMHHYEPLLRQLLANRGIVEYNEAVAFLAPDYTSELHDPFLMTDMARAVSRVLSAVKNGERIAIYSDYDCDGIPGAVILHDLFKAIGFTSFENYIPHRHHEGFGLNKEAVRELKERGAILIMTIDCGTVDHEAVAYANELGIDVIITDHHEPGETLPPAYAILNPKRDQAYPFRELCGSGVLYKFVCAFLDEARKENLHTLPVGFEKWLLDMVGIATIADMVPLRGENRVFAHFGLTVLRKSKRPGLRALFQKTRMNQSHLTEDDIGFTIGPRINAASRMDTPEDAFHFLATTDVDDARARFEHLEKLNNERKGMVASMSKELKKRIALMTELPDVIVIGNPDWKPALVGLTANTLVETYKRPVFLWGRDGRGIIKGSCRSDGETSVVSLMHLSADAFLEFGGHHGAGGFSVLDDRIHDLSDVLNRAYLSLTTSGEKVREPIMIDADLTFHDFDTKLFEVVKSLAPFGEGNPKPLFRFVDAVPKTIEVFGKAKEHTKVLFESKEGMVTAIAFFKRPEQFGEGLLVGVPQTLLAHVEESFFMNRRERRLRIVDILPTLDRI